MWVVAEATSSLGGRASTDERNGHLLNRGAHALYEGGAGMAVLGSLGIDPPGGSAPSRGALRVRDGRLQRLPVGPVSLLRSPLLTWCGRLEVGRLLVGIDRRDAHSVAREAATAWIASVVKTPCARALLAALVRLSTYSADQDSMSAEVAVTQLQLTNGGVRYLDGGWQSLVDALAARARGRGVELRVGSPVRTDRHRRGPRCPRGSGHRRHGVPRCEADALRSRLRHVGSGGRRRGRDPGQLSAVGRW